MIDVLEFVSLAPRGVYMCGIKCRVTPIQSPTGSGKAGPHNTAAFLETVEAILVA
jgi:hypothetical protein